MAKFSPQDLFSPMKKMEKSLEDINTNVSGLIQIVSGVGSSVNDSLVIINTNLETIVDYLKIISKKSGGTSVGEKLKNIANQPKTKENPTSIKEAIELFSVFGEGIQKFSKGMLLFALVPKSTGKKFKDTLTNILEGITEIDKESIDKAKSLGDIGESIFKFVGFTALAGIVAVPAAILTPFIRLCISGMVKTFELLSEKQEDIEKGAESLQKLGIALGIFSLSILAFGLTTRALSWKGILMGAATIAIFGLLALGIGATGDMTNRGADVLVKIGKSIALFSVGLLVFSFAVKMISLKEMLIGAASILVLTGVCAALGIPIVSQFVMVGAKVLQAIVKPVLIFSLGLLGLALVLRLFNEETISKIGPVLGGVGLAVAKVGLLAIAIIPGALALAAVGVALSVLTLGLVIFKQIRWTEDDTKQLVEAISGIRLAFLGDDGGKKEGIFSKIGGVVGGALDAAAIIVGAGAYIVAAISIMFISGALALFKTVKWTEEDSKELAESFTAVRIAICGSDGKKQGLFAKIGSVVGSALDTADLAVNSAGLITAGFAIMSISRGLKIFKTVNWTEEDSEKLMMSIGSISSAFAQVVGEGTIKKSMQISGLFGQLLGGFTVEKSAVKEGIDSVKGAGKALRDISQGLIDFTDWYAANQKILDINNENSPFFIALKTTISAIGQAFASVANVGTVNKSVLFGLISYDTNAAKEGIENVKGAGDALKGISEGLIDFTNWYAANKKVIDIDDENSLFFTALKNTISAVGSAFASIGGMRQEKKSRIFLSTFSFDKSAVQEGIKAVDGVMVALVDITNGVKSFIDSGITDKDIDLLGKLLTGMGQGFSSLGKINLKVQGKRFSSFAINFAEGFDKIYKQKDMYKRMSSVNILLKTMEKQIQLDVYNKTASGVKKIADAINSIDIEKGQAFADLFVASSKLKDNSKFYEDLMKAVEDIKKALETNNANNESNKQSSVTINQQQPNTLTNRQPQPQPQPAPPARAPKTINADSITIKATSVIVNNQ